MTSGGRRGAITDLLTTSRHPFRSFDTLRDSAARRQVQSLILSSHRFLWPPLLLPPLTVPCMIVFERPEDLETWPYHFSFLLLTVVSKSSYGPMARSILLRTSTFVMCSVYDMLRSCCCYRPTPPACSCGGVRQPSFSREALPGVSST